ncbi:hypothetical protein FRC17_000442 [Serendipita sp. 399]|nr:hypothetical protein FRC17_000442 [Serendipita sp. 399]
MSEGGSKVDVTQKHESELAEGTVSSTTPRVSVDGAALKHTEAETPSVPSALKKSNLKAILLVAACTGTMIFNVASAAGVNLAIPVMAAHLQMSNSETSWIVTAFTLSSGCLLLLFGRLADLYGRKLTWMLGMAFSTIFTLGCGFSATANQLIILRAMSGIGQAATIPAAIGILAHSFPPTSRARSTAFATFAAGAPLGACLGMVFGGVMAQYASWRGVFYFAAGLGLIIFACGVISIGKDTHHQEMDKRVDWLGAFLVTTGLVLLTYALSDGATHGWSSALIVSCLVFSVVFIALFFIWERHLINNTTFPPLMQLNIWTRAHGRFAAMQLIGFLEWASFTSFAFWIALYYQNYLHLSPILTTVRFLPMAVTGVICNVIVALVVGRINGVYLIGVGTLATSMACLLLAIIDPSASYFQYAFIAHIISVFGADFTFATGTLFVAKVAHLHEQSLAGALLQTLTMLGTTFGLSISTITQTAGAQAEARRRGLVVDVGHDAILDIPGVVILKGYRVAQWTSFGFGMLAFATAVVFLHGIGVVGAKKKRGVDAEKGTDSSEKVDVHSKEAQPEAQSREA